MSQQHGFPPPPPPSQSSASPGGSAPSYFSQQRLRPGPPQPPSITTNFLRAQGVGPHSQTPASALSPAQFALPYSPATPSTHNPHTPAVAYPDSNPHLLDPSRAQLQSPGSPSMAQQPYDPRQWSGHGSHMAYSQHSSPLSRANVEITGMESTYNAMHVPGSGLSARNNLVRLS